jgi:TM2 domain-containing membrane protein YozV
MNDARTKGLDEKFCSECGEAIKVKAEICPKCGVRQAVAPTPATSSRNKTVAGLLALFLGSIGIHKFYLGKGFQGLLYLIFCWTIIPAVVGFIEGLNYLLMSDETFNKRYA